jgi:hypothetical protein
VLCQRPARAGRARSRSKSELQRIGCAVGTPVAVGSTLDYIALSFVSWQGVARRTKLELVRLRGGWVTEGLDDAVARSDWLGGSWGPILWRTSFRCRIDGLIVLIADRSPLHSI